VTRLDRRIRGLSRRNGLCRLHAVIPCVVVASGWAFSFRPGRPRRSALERGAPRFQKGRVPVRLPGLPAGRAGSGVTRRVRSGPLQGQVLAEEQPDLLELLAAEVHFLAVKMSLVDLRLPVDRLWRAHPSVDLLAALGLVRVSEERVSSVVKVSAQNGVRHTTHPSRVRPSRRAGSFGAFPCFACSAKLALLEEDA
jgi:hypothetical protein